jgi:hypothetical protein
MQFRPRSPPRRLHAGACAASAGAARRRGRAGGPAGTYRPITRLRPRPIRGAAQHWRRSLGSATSRSPSHHRPRQHAATPAVATTKLAKDRSETASLRNGPRLDRYGRAAQMRILLGDGRMVTVADFRGVASRPLPPAAKFANEPGSTRSTGRDEERFGTRKVERNRDVPAPDDSARGRVQSNYKPLHCHCAARQNRQLGCCRSLIPTQSATLRYRSASQPRL